MDKQLVRDRINELKFNRRNYDHIQKITIPTIIGFTAIYLSVLGIYFQDITKYIVQIIVGTELYFFTLFILLYLGSFAKKKDKYFLDRIQFNFDFLLNRPKLK